MFDWYTKKLNEFIQVARYCHHPILEAHMVLARSATQQYLADKKPDTTQALDVIIRLVEEQAKHDGFSDTAAKLSEALDALSGESRKTAEIVSVDFQSRLGLAQV